jgi:hypothetical protein
MAFAFDTLGYAKRLRDAGIPQKQAEAHAEAAREFIMTELVTKSDLSTAVQLLDAKIDRQGLVTRLQIGGMLLVGCTAVTTILGFLIRMH